MGSHLAPEEGEQVAVSLPTSPPPRWDPIIPPRSSSRAHAGGSEAVGVPRLSSPPLAAERFLSMDHELRVTQSQSFNPISLKIEAGWVYSHHASLVPILTRPRKHLGLGGWATQVQTAESTLALVVRQARIHTKSAHAVATQLCRLYLPHECDLSVPSPG